MSSSGARDESEEVASVVAEESRVVEVGVKGIPMIVSRRSALLSRLSEKEG